MSYEFTYEFPDAKAFLHTLQEYLKIQKLENISNLLAGASCEFSSSNTFSSQRWNAYKATITLRVPIDKLDKFTDEIQENILNLSYNLMDQNIGFDLTDIEVSPILISLNKDILESQHNNYTDLFKHQFPLGMPFGKNKPHVTVIPHQGSQKTYFEETKDIGLIK